MRPWFLALLGCLVLGCLATLAALCDILGCQPGELVEVSRKPAAVKPATSPPARRPRPVRARVDPGR